MQKAWSDDAFKRHLLTDPMAVLREHGIQVAPGVNVKVVEDTPQLRHFVLPMRAPEGGLSDRELDSVAGGVGVADGGLAPAGTLFTPPTDTSFSTASGLDVMGSDFTLESKTKPGGKSVF